MNTGQYLSLLLINFANLGLASYAVQQRNEQRRLTKKLHKQRMKAAKKMRHAAS